MALQLLDLASISLLLVDLGLVLVLVALHGNSGSTVARHVAIGAVGVGWVGYWLLYEASTRSLFSLSQWQQLGIELAMAVVMLGAI